MDFVAIDFETADHASSTPCALGIAVVRNGEIVERQSIIGFISRGQMTFIILVIILGPPLKNLVLSLIAIGSSYQKKP